MFLCFIGWQKQPESEGDPELSLIEVLNWPIQRNIFLKAVKYSCDLQYSL